jgi:hypothetical protein
MRLAGLSASETSPAVFAVAARRGGRVSLGDGVVMATDEHGTYCQGTSGVRHYFTNDAEFVHARTAALTFCGVLPKDVTVTRDADGDVNLYAEGQQFLLLPDNAWSYRHTRKELSDFLSSLRKPAPSESTTLQDKNGQ